MASSQENVTELLQQPAVTSKSVAAKAMSVFANMDNFESAQRMAKLLCSSTLIPVEYQNNVSNTTIALEMANRIGASPMAVMQNLYIVHGKPGWSAQFIIASLNTSGKFSPLRYQYGRDDNGKVNSCFAWAKDLEDGERLEGPTVTWDMATAEGWVQKKGSKWQTMPDVMFMYRAASFFGKMYSPELLMGMQTAEELQDIIDVVPDSSGSYGVPETGVDGVKSALKTHTKANPPSDVPPPATNTTVIDGDTIDTDSGEVIDVAPEAVSANDKVKANLAKKTKTTNTTKPTNANNAHPDQF